MPTRPVDREKAEGELSLHIKKATSAEETSPKQKHVRSKSGIGESIHSILITSVDRVHRVHVGLSFFAICLEWLESAAYPQ